MNIVPYGRREKYPHMGKEDIAVWERYIASYPNEFDSVAYDVKVGVGHPPRPDMPDEYKKMQLDLSKKRIDVVGINRRGHAIIEVKPYASLSAVGQVQVYAQLYQREMRPRGRLRKLIICKQYDADIIDYCNNNEIEVATIQYTLRIPNRKSRKLKSSS